MYRLHRETFIPASIEAVFDFFSRADNLNLITPPWLHFKILTKENIRMADNQKGTLLTHWNIFLMGGLISLSNSIS